MTTELEATHFRAYEKGFKRGFDSRAAEVAALDADAQHYKALSERWRNTAVNLSIAQPEPMVLPSLDGIPKKMSELDVLNAEIHARTWHENGPCRECLVHLHRFLLEKRWHEQKRIYAHNAPGQR